jgi:N-acetylglucosamine malate deacetylase 1
VRVLCVGAHPDDCEGSVGGTALLLRGRGDSVTFVSVTDGSRGHHALEYLDDPSLLIERRMREARVGTEPHGIVFECLGVPDGEVFVTAELTWAMVRLIRRSLPDLVLLNRPCDYHRDHRYTAQLVLDASYVLTVPFLCPDVPALRRMPVFAYWQDGFTEGGPFRADVVVSIDAVIEAKREMMLAHESQYLEWLPYNAGVELPSDPEARRRTVSEGLARRSATTAERFGGGYRFAEAFQISEYGRRPDDSALRRLFPVK